jgi:hypothetical protein
MLVFRRSTKTIARGSRSHDRDNPRLDGPEVRHEPPDVPLAGVIASLAAVLLAGAIVHGLVWALMVALDQDGQLREGQAQFMTFG